MRELVNDLSQLDPHVLGAHISGQQVSKSFDERLDDNALTVNGIEWIADFVRDCSVEHGGNEFLRLLIVELDKCSLISQL